MTQRRRCPPGRAQPLRVTDVNGPTWRPLGELHGVPKGGLPGHSRLSRDDLAMHRISSDSSNNPFPMSLMVKRNSESGGDGSKFMHLEGRGNQGEIPGLSEPQFCHPCQ